MAGMTKPEALVQAKLHLMGSTVWSDAQLGAYCDDVVRDISMRVPFPQKTALPIIDTTRTVDISGLTSLVKVLRVETPVDTVPPDMRNWDIVGDILRITLDSTPAVTETLLTGTVTFTKDDATLSGAGTAFESEVAAGNFIKRSTETTWYKVLSITSDTELELTEAYTSGNTGDDTINVTPCRTKASMAYIYWGKLHTVGGSSRTLTGTITFTDTSKNIAGVGTDFAGEVVEGEWIRRSGEDTWYEVDEVTSDILLTVKIAYSGVTGDDTLDSTLCKDAGSLSLSARHDRLLVQGILAYAGMAGAVDVVNKVNIGDSPFGRYLTYAQQQLALYRKDVASLAPITVGQSHPRD